MVLRSQSRFIHTIIPWLFYMTFHMYNANQCLMHWSLALQEFNIEIVHKRGTENVIANALFRAHSAESTG